MTAKTGNQLSWTGGGLIVLATFVFGTVWQATQESQPRPVRPSVEWTKAAGVHDESKDSVAAVEQGGRPEYSVEGEPARKTRRHLTRALSTIQPQSAMVNTGVASDVFRTAVRQQGLPRETDTFFKSGTPAHSPQKSVHDLGYGRLSAARKGGMPSADSGARPMRGAEHLVSVGRFSEGELHNGLPIEEATAGMSLPTGIPEPVAASLNRERPGNSNGPVTVDPQEESINGQSPMAFKLAEGPQIGDRFRTHESRRDPQTIAVPAELADFAPGPCYDHSFDPYAEMEIYEGKTLNATQRPLLEWGKPWYQLGQLPEPGTRWGRHNPLDPQFVLFGDSRLAAASNRQAGDSSTLLAVQHNLFFDWRLTGTERFNLFVSPTTRGLDSTRYEFDDNDFTSEFNFNIINGFFEGDLGAMWGGLSNQTMPFDLPIAVGIMPLLFQNGVWMEDNILGVAATVPARNIPEWNVSNLDVTFFAGYDNVTSPAFGNDNNAARIYGVASFVEAWNGYMEVDYAFLDDRQDGFDRSYHNVGIGFSRRWGRWLSNSTRLIVNAGQDAGVGNETADGVLLLSENSLITSSPSNIVPYLNLFAGFDRPQSAARAGLAGGVLRNTGILFETDNLTGYPTLDATANNTFGAALGLNLMPGDFSQQLVLESALMGVMDEPANRISQGAQYGVAMRYQLPLSNSVLIRADAMYGFLDNAPDLSGVRLELRRKF